MVSQIQKEVLFLSVHPVHADAIINGTKTVELRKQLPRAVKIALIYATSPRKELLGWSYIQEIISESPNIIWKRFSNSACVEKKYFHEYYKGRESAVAIRLGRIYKFPKPIPLTELRELLPDFQPPQGYRYLKPVETSKFSFTNK